jgi:hypothetical protein
MSLMQKWLTGLLGLSALYIVAANPKGIAAGLSAGQGFISGTLKTAQGR